MYLLEEPFLPIDCEHLKRFNADLYAQLVRYPQEVIPTLDLAANQLFSTNYPDMTLKHQIQVLPPFLCLLSFCSLTPAIICTSVVTIRMPLKTHALIICMQSIVTLSPSLVTSISICSFISLHIQVRPYNAEMTKNMRMLNPEGKGRSYSNAVHVKTIIVSDIDQLITISGMVVRMSSLIPEMREGLFSVIIKWSFIICAPFCSLLSLLCLL